MAAMQWLGYGGDEFLLILADADLDGANRVRERIAAGLQDWNKGNQLEKFVLELSIGLVEWRDGMTIDEALDEADQRMYREKHSTREKPATV